jgi:membrane protein
MRVNGSAKQTQSLVHRIHQQVEGLQRWASQTIFWRVWERLLENEFVERAVALGAKAFVSLFPALIVIAAFLPTSVRNSMVESLSRRAGLTAGGLNTVRGAFANANDTKRATGILGLIFTFFFISSFTTALARVYHRAWRRPPLRRVSGYAIGASWLFGAVAYFALLGGLRAVFGSGPKTFLFLVFAVGASVAVWWLTPWWLLQRHVRPRVLLANAVLTGVGLLAYAASASVWMPRTVSSNQHQFGFFGVALSLVTWLTGAGMVIVIGACAGAVIAEDRGVLGRLARGGEDAPILVPGAPPSYAAPRLAPTLTGALGLQRAGEDDED